MFIAPSTMPLTDESNIFKGEVGCSDRIKKVEFPLIEASMDSTIKHNYILSTRDVQDLKDTPAAIRIHSIAKIDSPVLDIALNAPERKIVAQFHLAAQSQNVRSNPRFGSPSGAGGENSSFASTFGTEGDDSSFCTVGAGSEGAVALYYGRHIGLGRSPWEIHEREPPFVKHYIATTRSTSRRQMTSYPISGTNAVLGITA